MSPTVKEMVKQYMQQHGYTALYKHECGCGLDDLMPCAGCDADECRVGYANDCWTCRRGPSCELREEFSFVWGDPADVMHSAERCWEAKPA